VTNAGISTQHRTIDRQMPERLPTLTLSLAISNFHPSMYSCSLYVFLTQW